MLSVSEYRRKHALQMSEERLKPLHIHINRLLHPTKPIPTVIESPLKNNEFQEITSTFSID